MKLLRAAPILMVVLWVALAPPVSAACTEPDFAQTVRRADGVWIAEVVAAAPVNAGDESTWRVDVVVARALKGSAPPGGRATVLLDFQTVDGSFPAAREPALRQQLVGAAQVVTALRQPDGSLRWVGPGPCGGAAPASTYLPAAQQVLGDGSGSPLFGSASDYVVLIALALVAFLLIKRIAGDQRAARNMPGGSRSRS